MERISTGRVWGREGEECKGDAFDGGEKSKEKA